MTQYDYIKVPAQEVPPDVLQVLKAHEGPYRYFEATCEKGWFRLDRATGEFYRVEKQQ
jgi:hypothetical protein